MPLGPWELAIILVIIVIIFGVGKLPEIGGALGKGIREFKTSASDPSDDRDDHEPKNTLRATTDSGRMDALHSGPAREEL